MLSGKLRKGQGTVTLKEGFITLRSFKSPDGLHELVIFQRPDGFFGYAGHRFASEDGYMFWEPAESSGIYETAETAERAALAEITWFSGKISN